MFDRRRNTIRLIALGGAGLLAGLVATAWIGRTRSFNVRGSASIAFLYPVQGTIQVVRLTPPMSLETPVPDPTPITDAPHGAYDFAVHPDGSRLAYSALRADHGADLRVVSVDGNGDTLLVACPDARCQSPAYSPDGAWLAFERLTRRAKTTGLPDFSDSSVWMFDTRTGETHRVSDPSHTTGAPIIAPLNRLAYYDATVHAIVWLDLQTGESGFVPNSSGQLGTWSPDGRSVVFPDIEFVPLATAESHAETSETFVSHLILWDLSTGRSSNLSGETFVEDTSPATAPDGSRIAFARRYLDDERFTPGRQLWRMNADGSGAQALSNQPAINTSAIAWSPDGSTLVFMRFEVTDLASPASIWIARPDGSEARLLVEGGYWPRWVPLTAGPH